MRVRQLRSWTFQCLATVVATSFSMTAAAGYDMSQYTEGNFDYEKWYGKTDNTFLVRIFHAHSETYEGYLNANWDMFELTGEDGGPDGNGGFTSEPYKPLYTWHMRTDPDGSVWEVGDTYHNDDCTVVFDAGKEIIWGTGNMNFDQAYENQLHFTGGCGENWGWSAVRIIDNYSSYTLPSVTSSHGWSCPSATFQDVILIRHSQWYCDDPECSTQTADIQRYWLARNFGPIKLWGNNGYILRRLCEEGTSNCICAADWIQQN